MISKPLVSVLMTAYNRENFIGEAIQSVLDSNYTNFELIIVDDCSKDNTVEIANSFAAKDSRVKVFVNEVNLTDYVNRNKAASYANGKYIKYVDSDDMIYYFTLDVMVTYMERFPNAGFGLCSYHDERPLPICIEPREIYTTHFNGFGHFNRPPLSAIIRLDAFNKVSGFSGARMIGDYEFWLKIARYYPLVLLPYDLYHYRFHDGQEQNSDYAKQYDVLRDAVLNTAFEHPDCPLTKAEIEKIKKNEQKRNVKNRMKKILFSTWKKMVR